MSLSQITSLSPVTLPPPPNFLFEIAKKKKKLIFNLGQQKNQFERFSYLSIAAVSSTFSIGSHVGV